MGDFARFGFKKDILLVLSSLKLNEPTDVQEALIPLVMRGKSVAFTSRTGSGKTLAFTLGVLGRMRKQGLQMLVIVPTRELCIQVGKELQGVCEPLGIKVGMLYGGREIAGDKRTTSRNNQILVGTPGRLIQHINQKAIRVGDVTCLVFDESDQMFDQGFSDECAYVRSRVSSTAQILLASATLSERVREFVEQEMDGCEILEIGEQLPLHIRQVLVHCTIRQKPELLREFLERREFQRVIIFCNTKQRTHDLALSLKSQAAREITSSLTQEERNNTLNLFKQGRARILVATDVAARGIHIEHVDAVINYDVAHRPEFHIHRIGRTGRKDCEGYALTFLCPEDEESFADIRSRYPFTIQRLNHAFEPEEEP